MKITFEKHLVELILSSIIDSVEDLFKTGESFYYFSLITTGEGHPPILSAWSKEALHRSAAESNNYKQTEYDFKWSPSDSPYYAMYPQYWKEVNDYVNKKLKPNGYLREGQWNELMNSMVEALSRADEKKIFDGKLNRNEIFINAEVIPPDEGNDKRAKMLNPPSVFNWWTKEMKEEYL